MGAGARQAAAPQGRRLSCVRISGQIAGSGMLRVDSMNDGRQFQSVWDQKLIPVVLRRDGRGELLRVRLPFAADNRAWLRDGRSRQPIRSKVHECWELPKSWFSDLVDRALIRFGRIYVIQPYRELEKCAPACMNAVGHECQCSCMGANHGAGNDGSWFEVSETFAGRWRERELACRLMVAK